MDAPVIYRFSDLELDLSRRELTRDGVPIHLTKLSFKVLEALVLSAPGLLDYDELIKRVWGEDRIITPENLTQRIKVLRESLGDDAGNPRYIEAVRGQGVRLLPTVEQVAADQASGPAIRRWAAWGAVGLITLALILIAQPWPADEPEYRREAEAARVHRSSSVAVLPFANLSPDPNNAFYAAGLHEEVLNQLAKLKDLAVISRTSMLRFADTTQPIPDIAKELNVENVLEGSVRYADNRIRVTIQLVHGESDEHLWSETYDRELNDIFEIESDIARNVARSLDQVMSEEERARLEKPETTNLEAFAAYTRGSQVWISRTIQTVKEATAHFETATRLDPDYAQAWSALAEALHLQVDYGAMDMDASYERRQVAIDRALELDPLSGQAWLALTQLQEAQGLIGDPEPHYLKSIELSPNYAQAYHVYGTYLVHRDRADEALVQLNKALELDPSSLAPRAKLSRALYYVGRTDEALDTLYRGIELDPAYPGNYRDLNDILRRLGRLGEAMYWIDIAAALPGTTRYIRRFECETLAALGPESSARDCYDALVRDFPREQIDQFLLRFMQPDPETIARLYDDMAPASPDEWAGWMQTNARLGEWDQVGAFIQRRAPQLLESEPESVADVHLGLAVLAGRYFLATGKPDRADALFERVLEITAGQNRLVNPDGRVAGRVLDIAAHGFRSDPDAAAAALRDAHADGWSAAVWWLRKGPPFQSLAGHPEWEAALALFDADLAEQRAWFEQHRGKPFEKVN